MGLVAVVGALAARDLLSARRQLERANSTLGGLAATPEELASGPARTAAVARLDAALAELGGARRTLGRSVPLKLVAIAPGAGYQRSGLLLLVDDARDAARAGRSLLVTAERLERAPITGGRLDLGSLAAAQAELEGAAREMRRVNRGVRGLWGPLASARRRLDAATGPKADRLQGAADVVGALRGFAGEQRPRRYLLFGANNAEMRDQGAFLSFAVARLEAGRLTVERTDPVERIGLSGPAPIPVPPGTSRVFGALLPTTRWQSVNASADASFTARAAVAMFKQATGVEVDGVIVVDVPALASVLGVIGPVEVPVPPAGAGGARSRTLTEANAAAYLLSEQYEGLAVGSVQQARREAVSDAVDVVARRIGERPVDAVQLARRLGAAAAGRHLLLWSGTPGEQEVFERAGLGGGPGVVGGTARADRTFHVAVQEAGATKLDYFVRQRLQARVRVSADGTAVVRTTIGIENGAPAGARPSYALGPNNPATRRPGEYVARTYLWGPAGSDQPDSVAESGLLLGPEKPLTVAPQARGEVSFDTVIPRAVRDGRLDLRWVPQPRATPTDLEVVLDAPGWRVEGPPSGPVPLTQTRSFAWRLTRTG